MTSSDNQNKMKRGRYGNGRDGAVTPGARVKARKPAKGGDNDLSLINTESPEPATVAVTDLTYDHARRELTVVKSPVLSGGGAVVLGTVLGGNAPPLNYDANADRDNTDVRLDEQGYPLVGTVYPDSRPLSIPVPTIYNGRLRELPRVKDWARYILNPKTYTMGSILPRCPDGLCYVRLERPFALGGSSWASSYDEYVFTESTQEVPQLTAARTARKDFKTLYVYFDKDCILRTTRPLYKIIATPLVGSVRRPSIAVSAVTVIDSDRQALKITLSRALDPLLETVAITIPASTVLTVTRPPKANIATTLTVEFSADAYSVIMAVNRNASQGFAFTDLVQLSSTPLKITDETAAAVTVDCYEITTPAGPNVPPHSHQTSGGGPRGGGPAMLVPNLNGF